MANPVEPIFAAPGLTKLLSLASWLVMYDIV